MAACIHGHEFCSRRSELGGVRSHPLDQQLRQIAELGADVRARAYEQAAERSLARAGSSAEVRAGATRLTVGHADGSGPRAPGDRSNVMAAR